MKMSLPVCLLLCAIIAAGFCVAACAAQEDIAVQPVSPLPPAPVAIQPPEYSAIPLQDVERGEEQWEFFLNQVTVRNVERAVIYPFRPKPETANGQAIIIIPGGGYHFVAMQNEGFPVAERLAAAGYTAFVLKYRTIPGPKAPEEFLAQMAERYAQFGKAELLPHPPAVEDLQTAIQSVSMFCDGPDYECDSKAIGAIGFSAGALSVIRALELSSGGQVLSHAALIYPPMIHEIESSGSQPLFLAIASDDPLFRQGGFSLPWAWLQHALTIELHLYASGGHGFGTLRNVGTSALWFDQYLTWLEWLVAD